MRLPGMSFENDWTGIVIRDTRQNVTCQPAGALAYSDLDFQVTHIVLGNVAGHVGFVLGERGTPDHRKRRVVFRNDITELFRRIAA